MNDNQIVSNNDVKSMNSALAEALLTLSSNSDNQAKATQSNIKALKDISYGVVVLIDRLNLMTCYVI